MKLGIYALCLLATFILSACGNSVLPCESLLAKSSYEDLNTTLRLSAPSHVNSFKLTDLIVLVVNNNSKGIVEVVPDQDIKIFWQKGNSWEPIKNGVDYLSRIDRLSIKTNDDPGGTTYDIALNMREQQRPVRVCVILEGLKNPDRVRSKVAAYTELELNP